MFEKHSFFNCLARFSNNENYTFLKSKINTLELSQVIFNRLITSSISYIKAREQGKMFHLEEALLSQERARRTVFKNKIFQKILMSKDEKEEVKTYFGKEKWRKKVKFIHPFFAMEKLKFNQEDYFETLKKHGYEPELFHFEEFISQWVMYASVLKWVSEIQEQQPLKANFSRGETEAILTLKEKGTGIFDEESEKFISITQHLLELVSKDFVSQKIQFKSFLALQDQDFSLFLDTFYKAVLLAIYQFSICLHNKILLHRVQILAILTMGDNKIIEMKTGEGKSFVTLGTMILKGLKVEKFDKEKVILDKTIHYFSSNDYLAKRDREAFLPVLKRFGLTTGLNKLNYFESCKTKEEFDREEGVRRSIYQQDIVFGTMQNFAFDYLNDNVEIFKKSVVNDDILSNKLAIVDEIDYLLIDEATTPFILSKERELNQKERANLLFDLILANEFASNLKEEIIEEDKTNFQKFIDFKTGKKHFNADYFVIPFEKSVIVNDSVNEKFLEIILEERSKKGKRKLKEFEEFYYLELLRFAILAKACFVKNIDYLVKLDEENKPVKIEIINTSNGRKEELKKFEMFLQNAIEVKEGIYTPKGSETIGMISCCDFIKKYKDFTGCSGTIYSSTDEVASLFNKKIIYIPTNLPLRRKEYRLKIFENKMQKIKYVEKLVYFLKDSKKPILIVCESVEESEMLAEHFVKYGLNNFNLLNATQFENEVEVFKNAGQLGALTISTIMAGRGVDIKIEENGSKNKRMLAKKSLGSNKDIYLQKQNVNFSKEISDSSEKGLVVISMAVNKSVRIDNQIKGRVGRQGLFGEFYQLLSLDDLLFKKVDNGRLKDFVMFFSEKDREQGIESVIVERAVRSIQKVVEINEEKERFDTLSVYSVIEKILNVLKEEKVKLKKEMLKKIKEFKEEQESLSDIKMEVFFEEVKKREEEKNVFRALLESLYKLSLFEKRKIELTNSLERLMDVVWLKQYDDKGRNLVMLFEEELRKEIEFFQLNVTEEEIEEKVFSKGEVKRAIEYMKRILI